eukprot:6255554-Pyramimonas_sp.AAC.1
MCIRDSPKRLFRGPKRLFRGPKELSKAPGGSSEVPRPVPLHRSLGRIYSGEPLAVLKSTRPHKSQSGRSRTFSPPPTPYRLPWGPHQ